MDIAVENEFIQKSGSWFAYNGERIGQGRTNAKKYLEERPDIAAEVEAKIRETLSVAPESTAGAIPEDVENDGDAIDTAV